jgi:uncharacterized protein YjaZ
MLEANFLIIRTDETIRKVLQEPLSHRPDKVRYDLIQPFADFWQALRVPLKARSPGGYDALMASRMLGMFDPNDDSSANLIALEVLENARAWEGIEEALVVTSERFSERGFTLRHRPVKVMLLLGDPNNISIKANGGFTGMGGIPGFMLLIVVPTEYTLAHLRHLATHEFSHQVKLTLEPWNQNISLGEYLILEGLADSLVKTMYGEQALGPWITSFDQEDLAYSKEIIKKHISLRGFHQIRSYMFGDDLAEEFGYERVGLSHAAGYAVGFNLVQDYLTRSGDDIFTATFKSSRILLNELGLN